MTGNGISRRMLYVFLIAAMLMGVSPIVAGNIITEPYLLDTGLVSRSISFENPTGAPGEGGKASSNLGAGRKGSPARTMKPGDVEQLCDIEGPGTIRHIWVTTQKEPKNLRSLILRVWWEGQKHPSIECPIAWRKECRITIQQIAWKNGLSETRDDWSCATFWYEPAPSAPLPKMPDAKARTENIWAK